MNKISRLLISVVTFLFIIAIANSIATILANSKQEYIVSPIAEATHVSPTPQPTPTPKPSMLPSLVDDAFENLQGRFAIVIKHLQTNESYAHNEHEIFEPASLYKLWVMGATMQQVQNGVIQNNTFITDTVENLNQTFQISSESAERTDGIVSYIVKDAIVEMITLSDNYSALLLSKTIRHKTIESFLKTNQLHESQLGQPPKTTANDIAIFFEKLYRGALINKDFSKEMLDILKKQKIQRKIPKYLPKGIVTAHKTGELGTFSHDTGIIFHKTGDYILVILTDTPNPQETEETIAKFSLTLFQYFTNSEDQ